MKNERLYPPAKFDNLGLSGFHRFLVLDGAQTQAGTAGDFHMSVEMRDAFDDAIAFSHAGAGSQGDCVAFLSAADGGVGLMGIAPGGAAVNKGFELPGNVCPIGGGYGDDDIRPLKFADEDVHIVPLDAFAGVMTGAAAFAEAEMEVIDANASHIVPFP